MATLARVRAVLAGASGLPGLYSAYFNIAGTTPTLAEANDVCGRVRAMWNGVATLLAPGMTVTVDPVVISLDAATGALLGSTAATPVSVVTGTGAAEAPAATMLGLQLITGVVVGGRFVRGRSFIGPVAVATNSAGVPTAGSRTSLASAGLSLLTGATGSTLVVWSRPDPITHVGGGASNVSSVAADSKFWVLRSRRD